MAKPDQSKPAATQPKFPINMTVDSVSLVVDRAGVAWWVDPHARKIWRADV